MSQAFEALQEQQFINLTTYRQNGQPVATTVWFAHEGDRIVGTTQQQSGKIKRMRGTPRVSVTPSTFDGRVLGAALKKRSPPRQRYAPNTARNTIR